MSYTEQMENVLFQQWDKFDDYNEDYKALIEAINSGHYFRSFGDGLLDILRKKKPGLTADKAAKYIEEICKNTGIPMSAIGSPNTLDNWFKNNKRPKKGEDSREKMFALAFALKLTSDETAELFHKVYLDRAFDYRNANEIVYYFCLYNQKTRQEARRLINSISVSEISTENHTVYTAQIKTDIEALSDETALLSYISKQGHNLTKKNVTAKQTVEKLIAQARIKAKEETELQQTDDAFRGKARESNNFVYEVITGLSITGVKGTKTLFKNANLPGEIKKRFPEALTLSKKDPTYEELRKMIILLFSYCYWYKMQSKNTVIELDDYIEEINVHLYESGFSLMYYGNPYDWLFLYCTLSDRPLDTFRGLLAEALYE